jgi:hypothetical protein
MGAPRRDALGVGAAPAKERGHPAESTASA